MAVSLTNKDYYDDIRNQMLQMEEAGLKPTISDMIDVMGKKGNRDYYHANLKVFSDYALETPFKNRGSIIHEISHLFAKLGHTPQQEMFLVNVLLGITHRKVREPIYKSFYERNIKQHRRYIDDYTKPNVNEKWEHFSKQNSAIYFALGLYAKQKIANMTKDEFLDFNYEQLREKCIDYAKPHSDSETVALDKFEEQKIEQIENMSWRLVDLSAQEWRSIIAVATNKAKAEDTDYPKRMAPIEKTLERLGFYADLTKPFGKISESSQNR